MAENPMKKCPQCQMEISPLAKKCPHCQSKIKQPMSVIVKFFLIALGISIFAALVMGGDGTSQSATPDSSVYGTPQDFAWVIAENQIEKLLKSPSTAEFCKPKVTDLGNNKYVVASCVDSQNGFGAMLRSNWTVTLTYSGYNVESQAGWKINMVVFDDKVVYDSGE
jgi:hypothetical protein